MADLKLEDIYFQTGVKSEAFKRLDCKKIPSVFLVN